MIEKILCMALLAGAAGQLLVAFLNLFLVRLMHWEKAVEAMPLLVREVFQVHKYFITITVALFGIWTILFIGEIVGAATPMARALAGGIAFFWSVRAVIQITYYSPTHWRGKIPETAVHMILIAAYGGLGIVYGCAALGVGK